MVLKMNLCENCSAAESYGLIGETSASTGALLIDVENIWNMTLPLLHSDSDQCPVSFS